MNGTLRFGVGLGWVALLGAACGGSSSTSIPANVGGQYSGPVVDGDNSCPGLWNKGNTTQVDVTATQTDQGAITLKVTGGLGLVLDALLGSDTFTGTVSGSQVTAVFIGNKTLNEQGCTHIWQTALGANLDGNTLSGTLVTTPSNMSGTCAAFMGCSRTQTFTLTRPM